MTTLFENSQELIDAFGVIESKEFYEPVILSDTSCGFSIKKDYPLNIRFKPAVGQKTKTPDNIAIIWVVYTNDQSKGANVNLSRVPIRLRIANVSKYRASRWDYNFDDVAGDCPTKESLEASLATPQPLDLQYESIYFYDHILDHFLDKNGKVLKGHEILNKVFDDHCNTVSLYCGMKLKLILAWQSKLSGLLTLLIDFLTFILKQIFGRTTESNQMMAGICQPYKRESFKRLDEDSLDILGYKASKHVVIVFCALVIIANVYRYYYSVEDDYFSLLEGKEFLSVAHGIFAVWLIDVVIPWVIFFLRNLILLIKKALI